MISDPLSYRDFRETGPRPTKFGACAGPGILLDEVRLKTKYANKQEVVIRNRCS